MNFGFIARGSLSEIEKLQKIIEKECRGLKIVYCIVSAKKLYLVKRRENGNERESRKIQASA